MSATEVRLPRGRRGTAGVVAALLLVAVTGAAGYLAVMAALDRPVTVVDIAAVLERVRSTPWSSTTGLVVGIVLAVLGVVALLAALVPPRRRAVELVSTAPMTATGITRAGLRRTLEAAAVTVDGVTAAHASVGRRRIRVDAVSGLRRTDGLQDAAGSAVQRRLQVLNLRQTRALTTHLQQKDA